MFKEQDTPVQDLYFRGVPLPSVDVLSTYILDIFPEKLLFCMLSERETKETLLHLTRLELCRFDSFGTCCCQIFSGFCISFLDFRVSCFSVSFSFCGQTNRYV